MYDTIHDVPLLLQEETTTCLGRRSLSLRPIYLHHTSLLTPVFAVYPFLFTAVYMLAGWLFLKVRVGWKFQMWAPERPSSSWQIQLSQFKWRLTLYQTVFLPGGDNHILFTVYKSNVTLNEEKRCAGSMVAVWAFLGTAYEGSNPFKQVTITRIDHIWFWGSC